MRVVSIEEFYDKGWRWAAEEARVIAGEGPAYFSFDIDSLDPAYALGTGTPEPGGLTTLEVQRLIRELGALNLVGADLVEVSPPFDTSGMTSMTAAAILFELLCVLAQARVRRKPSIEWLTGNIALASLCVHRGPVRIDDALLDVLRCAEPVACGAADHGCVATADGRLLGTTRYWKSRVFTLICSMWP